MKFNLHWGEVWPVLSLQHYRGETDTDPDAREFTDEEIADLKRVRSEFLAWQTKLAERFEVKGHKLYMDVLIEESEQ